MITEKKLKRLFLAKADYSNGKSDAMLCVHLEDLKKLVNRLGTGKDQSSDGENYVTFSLTAIMEGCTKVDGAAWGWDSKRAILEYYTDLDPDVEPNGH